MIPLGSKLAPSRGVISWNNSCREGRIHFVGKLTQVSDSGPSWPSCFFLVPPLSPNEKNLRHFEKNGASWCHFKNEIIGIQQ